MSDDDIFVMLESISFPRLQTYKYINKKDYEFLEKHNLEQFTFNFIYNEIEYNNFDTKLEINRIYDSDTINVIQKIFGQQYNNPFDLISYILQKIKYEHHVLKFQELINLFSTNNTMSTYCNILYAFLISIRNNKELSFFNKKLKKIKKYSTILTEQNVDDEYEIDDIDFTFIINKYGILFIYFYVNPMEHKINKFFKFNKLNQFKKNHTPYFIDEKKDQPILISSSKNPSLDNIYINKIDEIFDKYKLIKSKEYYYIDIDLNYYYNLKIELKDEDFIIDFSEPKDIDICFNKIVRIENKIDYLEKNIPLRAAIGSVNNSPKNGTRSRLNSCRNSIIRNNSISRNSVSYNTLNSPSSIYDEETLAEEILIYNDKLAAKKTTFFNFDIPKSIKLDQIKLDV